MGTLRYAGLAAFAFLTAGAVAQPPARPKPDGRAPEAPRPVVPFGGHTTEVMALAFHADGKQVVSVSTTGVRFWQAAGGKESASHKISWTDHGVRPVFAIGPDGPDGPTVALVEYRTQADLKRLVANVVLISATGGKELLAINPHGDFDRTFPFPPDIDALAFSPDGKHLVTAGSVAIVGGPHGLPGGAVKIWDAKTGKELRQLGERKKWDQHFQKPLPSGEVLPGVSTSARVSSAAYSADGKYIVAGTYGAGSELPEAGEVWIWNAADGKLVRMFTVADEVKASGPDYRVSAVALSRDKNQVAAAVAVVPGSGRRDEHPTEVRVWEVASGRALHTLRGHRGWVARLAYSPDGKWLASAGRDRVVRLWNMGTGKGAIAFPFDAPRINAVAFSPDGKLLAAGGGDDKSGEVRVWALPRE